MMDSNLNGRNTLLVSTSMVYIYLNYLPVASVLCAVVLHKICIAGNCIKISTYSDDGDDDDDHTIFLL